MTRADNERVELVARLRNFEGSDALGNGDFSVCLEAAAALEGAQVTDAVTPQMIEAGNREWERNFGCLNDRLRAIYLAMRSAAPTSEQVTDAMVEDACFAWLRSQFPPKLSDEQIRERIRGVDREHVRIILTAGLPARQPPIAGPLSRSADAVLVEALNKAKDALEPFAKVASAYGYWCADAMPDFSYPIDGTKLETAHDDCPEAIGRLSSGDFHHAANVLDDIVTPALTSTVKQSTESAA